MKSLEIFSGVGGLAKGLEVAGFNHIGFIEQNKDACNSLRSNFNPSIVFERDITEFDFSNINTVEIVAGGPPCQPFSLGGKHKANKDSRDMFPYAIKAIERLQPKAFIFENVKGLLRESFKDYFAYIILRLTYPNCSDDNFLNWRDHLNFLKKISHSMNYDLSYDVKFKLINAADFGVPQTRERVVIIGIRRDLKKTWVFPEPNFSRDSLLWDKYITGIYWQKHGLQAKYNNQVKMRLIEKYGMLEPEQKPWMTIRDCLVDVPQPDTNHIILDHIYRHGAKSYPGHTGSEIDEPAKTIKAGSHGVPGGENMIKYDCGSVRYFTVYEAKLIQTFPSDYKIAGSWGEAMRQIGNAVPVRLASIIGHQLRKIILE